MYVQYYENSAVNTNYPVYLAITRDGKMNGVHISNIILHEKLRTGLPGRNQTKLFTPRGSLLT